MLALAICHAVQQLWELLSGNWDVQLPWFVWPSYLQIMCAWFVVQLCCGLEMHCHKWHNLGGIRNANCKAQCVWLCLLMIVFVQVLQYWQSLQWLPMCQANAFFKITSCGLAICCWSCCQCIWCRCDRLQIIWDTFSYMGFVFVQIVWTLFGCCGGALSASQSIVAYVGEASKCSCMSCSIVVLSN